MSSHVTQLSPYTQDLRKRPVRIVAEVRPHYGTERATISMVAAKLGMVSLETVRKQVRRAGIDGVQRTGITTEESAEPGGCGPR